MGVVGLLCALSTLPATHSLPVQRQQTRYATPCNTITRGVGGAQVPTGLPPGETAVSCSAAAASLATRRWSRNIATPVFAFAIAR